MKLNHQLTPLLALLLMAGAAATSCRQDADPNADRTDTLDVYASLDDEEPLSVVNVSVQGGPQRIWVKSNVDFKAQWQDELDKPWLRIQGVEQVSDGVYAIDVVADPIHSYPYYTRRSGTLLLSSPENSFGNFMTVQQGLTARLSSDMSWSKYGSSNPLKLDGALSSTWTATDRDRHWDSTVLPGQEDAYLYAKNGYLQLGDDEGHGADLFTPYMDANHMRVDSLLVLSFRAVAYNDKKGNKDANKLSVEILGGGVLRDDPSKTRIDLEVPYFNPSAEDVTADMWEGSYFMVGFIKTDRSPFTGDTRIRFSAGDLSGAAGKTSRIFIDNVYIRRIVDDPVKNIHDQDIWTLNGGSGADRLLPVETATE